MLYSTKDNTPLLVDVMIDSEYFAAVCGFEYPAVKLNDKQDYAKLVLRAETKRSHKNNKVQYGMMVWQNKNYMPTIVFHSVEESIEAVIENKTQLPYPVIKRTEAWLSAFKYYLETKLSTELSSIEVEKIAKQKFIEHILD